MYIYREREREREREDGIATAVPDTTMPCRSEYFHGRSGKEGRHSLTRAPYLRMVESKPTLLNSTPGIPGCQNTWYVHIAHIYCKQLPKTTKQGSNLGAQNLKL